MTSNSLTPLNDSVTMTMPNLLDECQKHILDFNIANFDMLFLPTYYSSSSHPGYVLNNIQPILQLFLRFGPDQAAEYPYRREAETRPLLQSPRAVNLSEGEPFFMANIEQRLSIGEPIKHARYFCLRIINIKAENTLFQVPQYGLPVPVEDGVFGAMSAVVPGEQTHLDPVKRTRLSSQTTSRNATCASLLEANYPA
ncbi:hypothetical protein OF83DRAFT_1177806 [Amylostereum chailletii]|nr:hypothetical protein OF83DRAFT_1177806 [Amylostereum chailletii]